MTFPIYCINLEQREDRKKHAKKQFKKLNINNLIYLRLTKDKRGGVYGCFESHMKVWKSFLKNYPDEPYCLVLEDDFVPTRKSKQMIKKAVTFLDKHGENVDVLMLHHNFVPVETKFTVVSRMDTD